MMHQRSLRRRFVLATVAALAVGCDAVRAGSSTLLDGDYIDRRQLTLIEFGKCHSVYLQPWRSWMETVPASRFLDGIGVCMPRPGRYDPDLICRMLAEHGFRAGRVEIGWSRVDPRDESRLTGDVPALRALLAAMKRYGIRPLILLNAHHGAPCPLRFFRRKVLQVAEAGSRVLLLDDPSGIIPGRSGPCNLTTYKAAEALVIRVAGNAITLSKPLLQTIPAGTILTWATLKYRPFSKPGTPDGDETLNGWRQYTVTVGRFVRGALGTEHENEAGFDMEIWNELTFGSDFLYINRYYAPPLETYPERDIWDTIVAQTADAVARRPALFRGVHLVNGFSNTIPWPASSTQPPRVDGISKHPYAGPKNYPADKPRGTPLGVDGKPCTFTPAFRAHLPEYFATAFQTETLCRDLAPFTTNIYRVQHGRFARTTKQGGPVDVWITEVNFDPGQRKITDPADAMRVKARAALRYFCFYLGKGVRRVFLYNATGNRGNGELGLGTLSGTFGEYTRTHHSWPKNAAEMVSPQLRAVGNLCRLLRAGLVRSPIPLRPLRVENIRQLYAGVQFRGNGSRQCPDLDDRELLAILPVQVNPHRFVLILYVATVDIMAPYSEKPFEIEISGFRQPAEPVHLDDPLSGQSTSVHVDWRAPDRMTCRVNLVDTPRVLVVEEKARNQAPP